MNNQARPNLVKLREVTPRDQPGRSNSDLNAPVEHAHGVDKVAISVRDLWMSYPGKRQGDPTHVLERVNLDVREGEFVCIVGPSGCGKTTLLNIIAGFLRARGMLGLTLAAKLEAIEEQFVVGCDPSGVPGVLQRGGLTSFCVNRSLPCEPKYPTVRTVPRKISR